MRFVDTNILIYRVSAETEERAKREVAVGLLECDDLCLSVQVLQEFYTQATRPTRPGHLQHEEAVTLVQSWKRFPIQEMTVELMDNALAARARWRISYWDAAILEAARLMGCAEVLSEDLSDGEDYGGVRVVNPFRDSEDSILVE